MNQPRGPDPLYAGPRQGPGQSRQDDMAARTVEGGANSVAERAQRFEDEKRRIVESLFSTRDETGSQLESYITHVRVRAREIFSCTGQTKLI